MSTDEPMNDAEYQATQDMLVSLASVINSLRLDKFLERIDRAESIGPILDPTLYWKASRKIENVKRLAQAYQRVQTEIRRQLAEEGVSAETV